MFLARLSLALTALVFGGFGVWLLLQPEALASLGVELTTPAARTEIRGFYGGLEIGLALFFGLAASRPRWLRPALVAQVAAFGGIVLGRLFGFAVDGSVGPLLVTLMVAEIFGMTFGLFALSRLRGTALEA
jgi:hypothetical protein